MIRSVLRVLAVAGVLLIATVALAREPVPAPPPPAPETPTPETPAPETPAQETPAQETPAPTTETPLTTAPAEAEPAPPPEAQPEPTPQEQTPAPAALPAAPAPVQAQPLSQLDLFSTGRDAGLGEDVWKGSSADIARAVIPALAAKPLSPAAASLARRLLSQTSTAPTGAGSDLDLAVARARALLALGDAEDASLVLDRTPGVADHADLSQLAAEAALISEQDDKACGIAQNLTDGRDGLYWLRLRAFCQARAGKTDEAQLTFNLAGAQAKDVTTARLLSAFIAGAGDPGPASLHTGLGFALSSALKLDLAPALPTAAPAISRRWALRNTPPPAAPDASVEPVHAVLAMATNDRGDWAALGIAGTDQQIVERLIERGAREASPQSRARLQAGAAILASLDTDLTGASRAQLADFDLGHSQTAPARLLALDAAARLGLKGETALLALQIAQAGGAGGPAPADRCWIIRALIRVGLKTDAEAFAAEGLLALKGP